MNPLVVFDLILRKFDQEIEETKNSMKELDEFSPHVEQELKSLKNELNRGCGKFEFLVHCFDWIEEYSALLKRPVSRREKDCPVAKRKTEICFEFRAFVNALARSKKWTLDSSFLADKTENWCSKCQTNVQFEIDNGRRVCAECASEIQTLETGNTHLDYNRATVVGKFIYNRVLHFQDCIKQFQGKQNVKIPACVFEDLDKKFKDYRLLIDSDQPQIRYSKITKQHIKMFLQELKYAKHYENVNVIFTTLTTNRIDDISHLEKRLVDDFKELVTLYDKLHSKDKPEELNRKNFLNVQYLLFQLLRRHGYDCKIEQFAILKTSDRKLFHDQICCNLFQQLQWNFTPTF